MHDREHCLRCRRIEFADGMVIDTTTSFSFNPATNTIGTIASIPRATGETRALTFNGKMLVMGGGRVAPNPSNQVDIYDPATKTWGTGSPVPAFVTTRRDFSADTDGATKIWLAGGYAPNSETNSMETFCAAGPTPSPTVIPTPRPAPTPRGRPTPPPLPHRGHSFAVSGTQLPRCVELCPGCFQRQLRQASFKHDDFEVSLATEHVDAHVAFVVSREQEIGARVADFQVANAGKTQERRQNGFGKDDLLFGSNDA